jgi:MFS transporter, FHS family, glucose/mannose:H+ symporter
MRESFSFSSRITSGALRDSWLFAGFVLTGVVTTLLGPILPFLSSLWKLDDTRAGFLFTAQFAGSIAGVLFSSVILSRRGPQLSLVIGYACMGVGVAALTMGSWLAGMIFAACYGFGLGLTIPTSNLLVAESNPHRRAAALNLLNLAWGLGAVIFPVLATGFLKVIHIGALLFAIGGVTLMFGLVFARLHSASWQNRPAHAAATHGARLESHKLSALAILGLLFFLYVGTENSLSGWIASFAHRVHANTGISWVLMPSFFWSTLLLGRAVAPLVLRKVWEIALARAGLCLALLGAGVVLISSHYSSLAAGVGLAGLGLSSIFPITISLFSHRFGQSASRFVGGMFALGGLGGATLPWLVGFSSNHFNNLRTGLWIPLLGTLAMLILYLGRWSRELKNPSARISSQGE